MGEPTGTARKVRSIDLSNPFLPALDGLCELLLIRHAEQEMYSNIPLGKAHDSPLSERGRQQAEALGERLASTTKLDVIFSSSTLRAGDTARAVARRLGIEHVIVEDLAEIHLWKHAPQDRGLLDLYTPEQVVAIYREVSRTRSFTAFPHVEDVPAFRERVRQTIDRVAGAHTGRRIGIVAHGGVINVYLAHVLGSPYDQLFSLHHTSITTVRASGDRRAVLTVNDYQHVLSVQDSINELIP